MHKAINVINYKNNSKKVSEIKERQKILKHKKSIHNTKNDHTNLFIVFNKSNYKKLNLRKIKKLYRENRIKKKENEKF